MICLIISSVLFLIGGVFIGYMIGISGPDKNGWDHQMKYDELIKDLEEWADIRWSMIGERDTLLRAAKAIRELQSTIVIVEVKEDTDVRV